MTCHSFDLDELHIRPWGHPEPLELGKKVVEAPVKAGFYGDSRGFNQQECGY